jgi:hypothetical protein
VTSNNARQSYLEVSLHRGVSGGRCYWRIVAGCISERISNFFEILARAPVVKMGGARTCTSALSPFRVRACRMSAVQKGDPKCTPTPAPRFLAHTPPLHQIVTVQTALTSTLMSVFASHEAASFLQLIPPQTQTHTAGARNTTSWPRTCPQLALPMCV